MLTQTPKTAPRTALAAVFLLFLATGTSGLIYQVVWQRYLLNLFGATIYSISTVLAAFMGGLALGSWMFGKFADRTRRPLQAYGVLEILIGMAALAVPLMLKVLDPIFTATYRNFGANFVAYSLVRFVFVFVILLIPTTMMGGTFPILSKFVSPLGQSVGLRVGLLYALNTFGAVTGTVLSGFFFIRWWGVSNTVLFAATINIGAGVLALLVSRFFPATGGVDAEPESTTPGAAPIVDISRKRLVLAAYAISGFSALGLEVAWSRSLVFTFELLKNTTYSFTAMLAVFLVGIALGSAVATPWVERERKPFRVFATLQVLIGLASIFSFFVLYHFCYTLGSDQVQVIDEATGNIRWTAALLLVFLRASATVLLPTFCMGLAFPFAVRSIIVGAERQKVGRDVGTLYAVNTLGAIAGSFLTGFLVLPVLGIAITIWLLGALQLAVGIVLIVRDRECATWRRNAWVALGAAAVIVAFARLPRPAVFQPLNELEKLVFYKEGALATVCVTENSLRYRTIYVDNVGVAGTEPMLLTDQKSLAHVPMLLLPNPKSALTVGFGSGGASYSYTLHPVLERIDCVEITKTIVEAAPTLTASHHDVVMESRQYQARTGKQPEGFPLWNDGGRSGWYKSDKRFRIVLDDVRSYLHFTDTKYDIIATDCTDLRYKSNANLYDLEYFELTRRKTTDDGMVVVWMPLAGLSEDAFKVALRTFQKVFPNMEVFYMNNEPTHYILLIGTRNPLQIDVAAMQQKLSDPAVAADLREIRLDSAEKILSCFICGGDRVAEYLKGHILNTEDFPYLEFESPRFGYGDEPILGNLNALMIYREHPARFLNRLSKYHDAAPAIIEGHSHYRRLAIVEAAKAYQSALASNPADNAVRRLLEFDELRRKVEGQPHSLWSRYQLARVLMLQNLDSEAVTQLNEIVRLASEDSRAEGGDEFRRLSLVDLASIYEKRGKPDQAARYRSQADRLPASTTPVVSR
jgi:spermidine synthase